MNKRKLIIIAAEYAVKEMLLKQSSGCLIGENIDDNIKHVKLHNIRWDEVLIGLRELESEEE